MKPISSKIASYRSDNHKEVERVKVGRDMAVEGKIHGPEWDLATRFMEHYPREEQFMFWVSILKRKGLDWGYEWISKIDDSIRRGKKIHIAIVKASSKTSP